MFFVNLADIACGFARMKVKDMKVTECNCEKLDSGNASPALLINRNPVGALAGILREALAGRFENVPLIHDAFRKIQQSVDDYNMAWDVIYNFFRCQLERRYSSKNSASALREIVDPFLKEFRENSNILPADKRLDIILSFMACYTYAGEAAVPIDKVIFERTLGETGKNAEGRIIKKWEKYVSFCLKEAQILFNGYCFDGIEDTFTAMWDTQEKIIDACKQFNDKTDGHTAAVLGTLAHSLAFNGNTDEAIKYFELSMEYAANASSKAQICSYLVTLYFKNKDIENVRRYFKEQTGDSPDDFAKRKQFKAIWELLSYVKLRALELHLSGKTNLPQIPTDGCGTGYPHQLILKWAAVAECIDSAGDKKKAEDYLASAANSLLEGKFTKKTIALPIIQALALLNSQNQYQAKYGTIVQELKKESEKFAEYIDKRAPKLNQIKNDPESWGVWERATALPFHYS